MGNDGPITDAVRESLVSDDDPELYWELDVSEYDAEWEEIVALQVRCAHGQPLFVPAKSIRRDAWQAANLVDAASALRLMADALSPDLTQRALEIAAATLSNLGECPLSGHPNSICPNRDSQREEPDCTQCWVSHWLEQAEQEADDE